MDNVQESNNHQYNEETSSKLNEIIEHIQKPKKLVLPKSYLRPRNTIDYLDIQDNLSIETISNNRIETNKETEMKLVEINILEPSEDVKKDAEKKYKKTKENAEKKKRTPTAYNIFVKETVIKLQESHKDLTPKERFKLAISMWSENKPTKRTE